MAIIPCVKLKELQAIESIFFTLHGKTNEEAQVILSAVRVNLPFVVVDDEVNANSFGKRVKPIFERFLIDKDVVN